MHDEETWLWRIQWAGRWCNSRHPCTEEQIRKEHPEATRIEGSRRIQSLPDSPEEMNQRQYNNTSFAGSPPASSSALRATKLLKSRTRMNASPVDIQEHLSSK